ncbi:hypothetical protein G7092_05560 [Mucilaginibacter sp. HC2]|uniref:hypothetical protein n=1 Tax=Mucilaginibacter inviolabilis TaxID=2714892 RepID=UPI00140E89AC|nr:hypothetical protein [Mucilaginibacter inviolabilis]NHA03247.1 hypothetical protein [Mucilaginibacter inviolabilis]
MNALLTRLGVSPEIQAFFNIGGELLFHYGDTREHYGEGFHKIPTTENLWVAGNETANEVIVSYSAMEAMAFIAINRARYANLQQLAFVAIGNQLQQGQVDWLRQTFPKRRFTLLFGKDEIGHLTDIKVAAGIRNTTIHIYHTGQSRQVIIDHKGKLVISKYGEVSLNRYKQAFHIRDRIRTRKPIQSLTFLDQLKYDAER